MKRLRLWICFGMPILIGVWAHATIAIGAGPGIAGELRGEDGQIIRFATVMVCKPETCYVGHSNGDGRFEFLLDGPGQYLIKAEMQGSSYGSPMVPVTVDHDDFIDVGTVYAPAIPEGVVLTPRLQGAVALEAGEGLTLTIDPDALETRSGRLLSNLAARRIPDARLPRYPLPNDEDVLAVYALHPFAARSSRPIAVHIESDLPAGTTVRFRTINDEDGSFSDPIDGIATGQALITPDQSGVTMLTHLVVSQRSQNQ